MRHVSSGILNDGRELIEVRRGRDQEDFLKKPLPAEHAPAGAGQIEIDARDRQAIAEKFPVRLLDLRSQCRRRLNDLLPILGVVIEQG